MQTRTILVHKANLPLRDGESLYEFQNALRAACKIALSASSVYCNEVYADKCVCEVYKEAGMSSCCMMECTYSRDANGAFTIGECVEVKAKTIYMPVTKAVKKSVDGVVTEEATPEEPEVLTEKAAPLFQGVI